MKNLQEILKINNRQHLKLHEIFLYSEEFVLWVLPEW